MRKSGLATFMITLSLVAAFVLGACSPERPVKDTRTAVPNDMPGARNSSAFVQSNGEIEISQPLPGTVVTNTVTVLGTGKAGTEKYHVDLETDGRSLAETTVTPSPKGSSTVFSATLRFEPVSEPVDAELAVYSEANPDSAAKPQVVVRVRLAPAFTQMISGPAIRLNPDRGRAGTPVVVLGEGFPADRTVEIRLSGVSTEATEHAYVSGKTSKNGDFRMTFTVPSFWPNGDPIVAPQVIVVASTPDFVSKATAIFELDSSVSPGVQAPGHQDLPAVRSSRTFVREHAAGGVSAAQGSLTALRATSTGAGAGWTFLGARALALNGKPEVNATSSQAVPTGQ